MHKLLINLKSFIGNKKVKESCQTEEQIIRSAHELLKKPLELAEPQNSRVLEWTDAGPGIGINNFDVRLRIGQRVRIMNLDYYMRHHLSNGDSAQNEVERCQSYIGDAICDGGTLEWEYKKLVDANNTELLKMLPYEKIEKYELQRMEYNAYKVCEELVSRVHGAPGPGRFLTA